MHQFTAPPDTICPTFQSDVAQFIPLNLRKAVETIDEVDMFRNERMPAWMSAGISLWAYIKHEEQLGNIRKGMTVLELGTGSGSSALTFSYMGYPIKGIELDKKLADYSREVLLAYSGLQNAPIQIFGGSYYPKKFVNEMDKSKNSLVRKIEREELGDWGKEKIKQRYFPICDEDVYLKNNISIKDFDIIYAYLWAYQFPTVLNMFKQYARDDALFLAIGPHHINIADKLGLKTTFRSHVIRK